MKQILQNFSNGKILLADVPCPKIIRSNILIATSKTVISAGTERMLVDFDKTNLLSKVKMVLRNVLTDVLITTVDAVRSKLDQPLPLGCCNTGKVNFEGEGLLQVVTLKYHSEFGL